MLTWSLPTLKDLSLILLLGVHLSTFFYFHSKHGQNLTRRLMKDNKRIVIQDTFKGYGKSLNLLSSIRKALRYDSDPLYFMAVLVIRCSITSIFKTFIIKTLIKRKAFKLKRTEINLVFNAVPSIIVYLAVLLVRHALPVEMWEEVEQHIFLFFSIFMVISRCIRSLWRVYKIINKK